MSLSLSNGSIRLAYGMLCLLFSGQLYSGSSFAGYVRNTAGSPLPYAIIYVEGESCGTLSDEDGYFSFDCPVAVSGEVLLRVDYLGYTSGKLYAHQFVNNQVITLEASGVELATIKVTPNSTGEKSILKYHSKRPYYYYQTNAETNYQLASRIANTGKVAGFATEIKFHIGQAASNRLPVRLHFYAIDPACDCPGPYLHASNIIAEVRKGKNNIDLRPYKISIPDSDFYVSFEWLSVSNKRKKKLDFSIGMLPVKSKYPLLEKIGGLDWRETTSSRKSRILTTIEFVVD